MNPFKNNLKLKMPEIMQNVVKVKLILIYTCLLICKFCQICDLDFVVMLGTDDRWPSLAKSESAEKWS